uniref:IS66 family insertion sequence element accessory protein TnpB n=1 Tax=Virgibacillus proomii TaxID=84407 RepID=UPI00209CDC3B|nr:IS66 family insertion sequence element accessory protein TnpB [Virgibacillus proomii]
MENAIRCLEEKWTKHSGMVPRARIKTHQMYYWVQQFREHDNSSRSTSIETQWLTVQMNDCQLVPSHEKEPIFIHVGSTSIEVRSGTDMNLLSDIVHVLEKQSC